jgi:hypothetical protein
MLAGYVFRFKKTMQRFAVELQSRMVHFSLLFSFILFPLTVDPEGVIEPQATAVTDNKGYAAYGNWEAFTFVSLATHFHIGIELSFYSFLTVSSLQFCMPRSTMAMVIQQTMTIRMALDPKAGTVH